MELCMATLLMAAIGQVSTSADTLRDSIQRSIPYIEERGEWWIEKKQCVSCHRVGTMVWSLSEARQRGFQVSEQLDEWIDWSIDKSLAKNDKGTIIGAGNKEGLSQLLLMLAKSPVGEKYQTQRSELVRIVVDGQEADGTWKPNGQLPSQKRPIVETTAVSTIWNALAIAGETDAADCYQQASQSIATSEAGKSTEWYVANLLFAANADDSKQVEKLLADLRSQQNDDGGWAWLLEEDSDALATGMALYALRAAGTHADDTAIAQAVQFLLGTQQPDGSWQVRGTKSNKKDRVEETASYWGTTWAAIGMMSVLP